eukprot:jgi/Botrbrau1/6715/Bobra.0324s0006.1
MHSTYGNGVRLQLHLHEEDPSILLLPAVLPQNTIKFSRKEVKKRIKSIQPRGHDEMQTDNPTVQSNGITHVLSVNTRRHTKRNTAFEMTPFRNL